MKIGDKILLRDPWIKRKGQIPPGTILDFAYYSDGTSIKVVFIEFSDGISEWINYSALKIT